MFAVLGRYSTSTPSGGGGHGSGRSQTLRHIAPLIRRRFSASAPRLNTLIRRRRPDARRCAAFGGALSALGNRFSASASSSQLP